MDESLLRGEATGGDEVADQPLRPRTLAEYVGQPRIKDNLAVFLEAARVRGDALDHVLLYGPPGFSARPRSRT